MLKGIIICLFCLCFSITAVSSSAIGEANQVVIPGYNSSEPEEPAESNKTSTENKQNTATTPEVLPEKMDVSMIVPNKLTKDQVDDWNKYLEALRNCTPGTYPLKQINPVLAAQFGDIETDQIQGWSGDDCVVTMMYYAQNDPRLTTNIALLQQNSDKIVRYPSGQQCVLSPTAVTSLINIGARLLSGQKFKVDPNDPFFLAVDQGCAPYVVINGEKTAVNPNEPLYPPQ